MDYKSFKEKREQLSSIIGDVIDIVDNSGYNDITSDGINPVNELRESQCRLDEQDLRVLVMGKFNGGKSAFLNGLIGRPLLPMGALPKTAVIGEIKYADNERVILTPKPGKWRGGDNPFEIKIAELDKYTSIEHTADGTKENPFHRAYIEYPLAICKEGIEFVDSPGLDDPSSHDEVTKQYLPTADAIIYCMTSLAAYSSKDRDEIDNLRAMGYKSIIFVLTYFDKLVENDEMMGSHDADDLKNHMYNILAPLTDLGKSGIFFVNSLAAIKGKMNNNPDLLNSSFFPEVEEKIEQILVNERGRLKLIRSVYQAKGINKRVGKYIRDKIEISKKDYAEFANKLTQAENALQAAEQNLENVEKSIGYGINDISRGARDKGELFLMSNLIPSVDSWVNEYEPEEEIRILHLKSSVQKYTEAHIDHIKSKMSSSLSSWCKDSLVKSHIEPQLERILIEQRNSLKQYEEDISRVRVNLELPINGDEIGDGATPSVANRVGAAGASLLIGDVFGAITGGALGVKAMLTTLAYELSAGIVLGIVGIFTPVGLPAMIIAAVIAALGGFGKNMLSIKNGVKNKIIAKAKEILSASDKRSEFGENIESSVKSALGLIKDKVHKELQVPIVESRKLVEQAREDMNKNGVERGKEVEKLKNVLRKQEEVENTLDEFSLAMNA